ncbi:MAG: insulinase family protein [Clostridiales bacterium]|jgi:predicted Zn-dependent peptidase|nr:insulinase family protein [Clostridiales bacterium]
MELINISNGVKLHALQTQKFKTVTVCLLIRRKLTRAEATLNALLPGVLRRGCEKFNTLTKINRELEGMYGAVFDADVVKKGEEQIIQFFMEFVNAGEPEINGTSAGKIPADKAPKAEYSPAEPPQSAERRALSFLAEILQNPLTENGGFRADIVSSEAENLKTAIEGRLNNKAEYAKLKCVEIMCENEAFGIYGDGYAEDLPGITPVKLFWHYKRVLKESPAEFIIIGNIDTKKTAALIKELFTDLAERENILKVPKTLPSLPREQIKARPALPAHVRTRPPLTSRGHIKTVTEEFNVSQGKICIGLKSGMPATGAPFYSLTLLNEILGGSANSRLFVNIREKKSLCYSIFSYFYRFKGIILIHCGADSDKLEEIFALCEKELSSLANKKVSEKELSFAKKSLAKKISALNDSPAQTADFYLSQYLQNDKVPLTCFARNLEKVTAREIKETAAALVVDTVYMLTGSGYGKEA